MEETLGDETRPKGTWDGVVERLHALREAVGSPSYGDIAQRISDRRQAEGLNEHAARVARTTVYDAFRTGRPRLNLPFVREIVRALGADPAVVEQWLGECFPTDHVVGTPEPEPITPPNPRQALLLMVGCVGLNFLGLRIVDWLSLPIYLDMVGTAVAAMALGPWRGGAVGVVSNTVGVLSSGWVALPFGLVNLAGALVWGYGVRRFGFGKTLPRYFLLNLVVAIVCSAVAVPILLMLYGNKLRVGHDAVTDLIEQRVPTHWLAVTVSNLMTSTMDKLSGGFIALVILSALPLIYRAAMPLALAVGNAAHRTDVRESAQ